MVGSKIESSAQHEDTLVRHSLAFLRSLLRRWLPDLPELQILIRSSSSEHFPSRCKCAEQNTRIVSLFDFRDHLHRRVSVHHDTVIRNSVCGDELLAMGAEADRCYLAGSLD
jgi:hypothetical protein